MIFIITYLLPLLKDFSAFMTIFMTSEVPVDLRDLGVPVHSLYRIVFDVSVSAVELHRLIGHIAGGFRAGKLRLCRATVEGRPLSLLLHASYSRYLAPSIFTFMEATSKLSGPGNGPESCRTAFLCFMYFTVSSKAPWAIPRAWARYPVCLRPGSSWPL